MRNMAIGLDLSLTSSGWAISNNGVIVACGKINTTNKVLEDDRIFYIAKTIHRLAMHWQVTDSMMESQFMYKNAKTALQLSRLRGGVVTLLKMEEICQEYLSPTEIKQIITGKGNAEKEDVAKTILIIHKGNPIVENVGSFSDKPNKNKTSDIYDAIAAVTAMTTFKG